jgi:putative ABC transport system substrate-binding protein
MGIDLRRREFLGGLGGAVVAWPVGTRAQQQPRQARLVSVLLPASAENQEFQARLGAFLQAMQEAGWSIGRNVRIDVRWATNNSAEIRRHAAELVGLSPDVILADGATTVAPLLDVTRTAPIVFPVIGDPVGAGFVNSLSRPGGNATGFMNFEYSNGAKWLELLKEIAPRLTRVSVMRDPGASSGAGQFGAIQATATMLGVEVSPVDVRSADELQRSIAAMANTSDAGFIVTANPHAIVHRDLLVRLAMQHKLPAIYFDDFFVRSGGLVSYGPDIVDQYRRAATYVDRVLKGEKPGNLPVQAPTKYELVINLKTAKALGITMPATLLARADEVIE